MGGLNFRSCLVNGISSLHCNISLSFCSFLYHGVCFEQLKLSVSQLVKKVPKEMESYISLGGTVIQMVI